MRESSTWQKAKSVAQAYDLEPNQSSKELFKFKPMDKVQLESKLNTDKFWMWI